jgi:hypothetical protein
MMESNSNSDNISMKINVESPPHITINPTTGNRIISIPKCEEPCFQAAARENTTLIGCMLSIWHFTANASDRSVITSTVNRSHSQTGNRQRTTTSKNYDRIVTFADLAHNQGKCFAFIFTNHKESTGFFRYCSTNQEGVANLFVIEEPQSVTKWLGTLNSVAIVEGCSLALLITNNYNIQVPKVHKWRYSI